MIEGLESLPARVQAIEQKLDALSSSVDQRFESVDQRFESIDRRFDAIDRRFDDIDRRFEEVNQHFVEQRQYTEFAYSRLERRMAAGFGRIEAKLDRVISNNLGGRRRVRSSPSRAPSRSKKRSR